MTEREIEKILGAPDEVHLWKSDKSKDFYWPSKPEQKILIYHGATNEKGEFEIFGVILDNRGRACDFKHGSDFSASEKAIQWLKNLF